MKSKFLYIVIGILIISNVYFLFNIFNKTKGEKNEETIKMLDLIYCPKREIENCYHLQF